LKFDDVYIGGKWVVPGDGEWCALEDPATETVFASVALAGAETMAQAVTAARRAFDDGRWTSLTMAQRMDYLVGIGEFLAANAARYGGELVHEIGMPVLLARGGVAAGLYHVKYWQQATDGYPWLERRRGVSGVNVEIARVPVGVVAAIVPWNAPHSLSSSKLVPALLAGCTVVLKPSPLNAVSLRAFADAAEHVGLPAGVLNVVPAGGPASDALVRHPGVDKVAFTGSDETGKAIAAAAAGTLKRVTLELGGKSAGVVLPDAPLPRLLDTVPPAFTVNNGEACAAMTRMLVPRDRQDEIVSAVAAEVRKLVVGDPSHEATHIGPLAFRTHYERVMSLLDHAARDGARIAVGGARPGHLDRGFFLEPTLVYDAAPDSEIAQREIFGPVLTVIPYESVDEAVEIANGTDYGLSSAVFGTDQEEVRRVAARMRAGSVHLNNGFTVDIGIPFGGFKSSGYGREFGPEGMDSYVEQRATFLDGEPYRR
jgi:acyl-CoA reductase-like NAD-dependent aldehyde dehydrogenase